MKEDKIVKALLAAQGGRKYPPIDKWHPTLISDSGMRIDRDCQWHYNNTPIRRIEMAKLFASVLRLERGVYYLVMPHEKLTIEVEDVPFQAVDYHIEGTGLNQQVLFTTNFDEHVIAAADNPLVLQPYRGNAVPYMTIRDGLKARLTRNAYYRLAAVLTPKESPEVLLQKHTNPLGIWSSGVFFDLQTAS